MNVRQFWSDDYFADMTSELSNQKPLSRGLQTFYQRFIYSLKKIVL